MKKPTHKTYRNPPPAKQSPNAALVRRIFYLRQSMTRLTEAHAIMAEEIERFSKEMPVLKLPQTVYLNSFKASSVASRLLHSPPVRKMLRTSKGDETVDRFFRESGLDFDRVLLTGYSSRTMTYTIRVGPWELKQAVDFLDIAINRRRLKWAR